MIMARPRIGSILEVGFRFQPTPAEAVTHYLPRLIAGEPMHAAIRPFIHATDIYACEPGVLAAQFRPTPKMGDRFFFTTFKLQPHKDGKKPGRAAGPGSWHSQGVKTDVKDGAGVKVGELKKFRYKKGAVFTDWLMDEFSSCSSLPGSVGGDRQYVLCKMYVSPRAAPDSAARRESDAFALAPPVPQPVAAAGNKRPAPPVAEPSGATKRTRVAAVPIPAPRVMQPPLPSSSNFSTPPVLIPTPRVMQPPLPSSSTFSTPPVPTCPVVASRQMTVQAPAPRHNSQHPQLPLSTSTPVPTRPVVPARHMTVKAPPIPTPPVVPSRHMAGQVPTPLHRSPQPSIHATTVVAPAAPCSPVAVRDPFCTESPAPAAAQEDDDFDFDFVVKTLEDNLEQIVDADDDDRNWFAPMMPKVGIRNK